MEELLLPVEDIQGDILAGFRKDNETFLFFRVVNPAQARVRIAALLPRVSPLSDVAAFNDLFRSVSRRRREIRGTLTSLWLNIAFTASGLSALSSRTEVAKFADASFRSGLSRRSAALGDPLDPTSNGHPNAWVFGGPANQVDVAVIIAGDLPTEVARLADESTGILCDEPDPGLALVWREEGQTRTDMPSHDFFGFRDGISQPGIRGRVDMSRYLTRREPPPEWQDGPTTMFSRPGQPLVWPGQFVLGLPRQRPSFTDPTPLPPLQTRPAWAQYGSYMVIRRLRQDVQAFEDFVSQAAEKLTTHTGFKEFYADRLAAMLVGRWRSGAPLIRTPLTENSLLGNTSGPANAFGYVNEVSEPSPWRVVDGFEAPHRDRTGTLCPQGAHIRKMNPRDVSMVGAPVGAQLQHLVLRRGLPFDRTSEGDLGPPHDRGLMFVSYQASIVQGFEFLQTIWANRRNRPESDSGGMDLLIGQRNSVSASRRRIMTLLGEGGQRIELVTDRDWVTPTGGVYLFAPSILGLVTLTGSSQTRV